MTDSRKPADTEGSDPPGRASDFVSTDARASNERGRFAGRPYLLSACAMIALTAATATLFAAVPRYEREDRDLLRNRSFADDLQGWRLNRGSGGITAANGVVSVRNEEAGGFVGLRQPVSLDDAPDAIEFSAEIAGENIRPGTASSHLGRVYLILRHGSGEDAFEKHHMLAEISGSQDWTTHSKTIPLNDRVDSISVNIQLRQATGRLDVRAPGLTPLRVRTGFAAMQYILGACWAAAFAWLIATFWTRTERSWAKCVGVTAALVLAAGAFSPDIVKQQIAAIDSVRNASVAIAHSLPGWFAPDSMGMDPGEISLSFLENLFHFAMFAGLAAFVLLVDRGRPPVLQIGWLAMLAGATEALQLFTDDRTPSLSDWTLDMAGVGLVYLVVFGLGGFGAGTMRNRE